MCINRRYELEGKPNLKNILKKQEEIFKDASDIIKADSFNTEIGVPLEYIAAAFGKTRNGFEIHRPNIHCDESIDLIKTYDKAVNEYIKDFCIKQPKRAERIKRAWNDNRGKYCCSYEKFRAAKAILTSGNNSDDDYKRVESYNREILLAFVKPHFVQLSTEKAIKLAYCYAGFVSIACFNFIGCISIMTPAAQHVLVHKIDAMTSTASEQFYRLSLYSVSASSCYKMLYEDYSKKEINFEETWKKFENAARKGSYADLVNIVAMLSCFNICDAEQHELEMLMKFSLFLTDTEQSEIISFAKFMLRPENVRENHKADELDFLFAAVHTHNLESFLKECYNIDLIEY